MHPAPAAPPASKHYPIWLAAGPAMTAVIGSGLPTMDFGTAGESVALDLGMPGSMALNSFAVCLAAMGVGAAIGIALRRLPVVAAVGGAVAVLFAVAALSFAPGATVFFAGKAIFGLGAGAALTAAIVFVRADPRYKTAGPAVIAGVSFISFVVTPVVGGILAEMFSWRLAYVAYIPPAGIALLVTAVTAITAAVQSKTPPAVTADPR